MTGRAPYWVGKRPSDGKRWRGAEAAIILDLEEYGDILFSMYRRYVTQWNEIELDMNRELSEHTFLICGAQVVGASGRFILTFNADRETGWILELCFRSGFHQYYPGLSTGLNALRTVSDIRRAALHWRGNGRDAFETWLKQERTENYATCEATVYKA